MMPSNDTLKGDTEHLLSVYLVLNMTMNIDDTIAM